MQALNFSFLFDSLHQIFIDGFWNKVVLGIGVTLLRVLFDFNLLSGIQSLSILVFFHFILGIISAIKTDGWSSVTLSKANSTPTKMVVYGILISSAFLTEKSLGGTEIFLDQMVVGFLAVAEFREILRHAGNLGYILPKVFMDKINNLFNKE